MELKSSRWHRWLTGQIFSAPPIMVLEQACQVHKKLVWSPVDRTGGLPLLAAIALALFRLFAVRCQISPTVCQVDRFYAWRVILTRAGGVFSLWGLAVLLGPLSLSLRLCRRVASVKVQTKDK
jgi:hypothetical protein